jgi:hypothetical protein
VLYLVLGQLLCGRPPGEAERIAAGLCDGCSECYKVWQKLRICRADKLMFNGRHRFEKLEDRWD